jgi:hypothetical protein
MFELTMNDASGSPKIVFDRKNTLIAFIPCANKFYNCGRLWDFLKKWW